MNSIIAVFDFDGTITYHDTLLSFLNFVKGPAYTCKALFLLIPDFINFAFRRISRDDLKEKILMRFLIGMPKQLMREKGEEFSKVYIPKVIRPEALKRIAWHQKQGHRCILISANLKYHLIPWANSVGIEEVVATECEVSPEEILTGRLQGKNCWGQEKLKRLRKHLGIRIEPIFYVYGDSKGDEALLGIGDYSYYKSLGE